jgi:hypothetical protein
MENLVYFPTFEPPSPNWLKFALLYVDNFNPIIPNNRRNELSTDYQRIIDNTDLIQPYHPKYDQGDRASLKAIEFIEKVGQSPYSYSNLFNRANIIRNISNPANRIFKIYQEKFSINWEDFCLSNNYAERTNDGIIVSEELAFIFMTFLAEEIAFEEGKSIITDNNSFDNFLNYRRTIPRKAFDRQNFAQGILSLTVPRNISEIPIANLIRFRNKNREKIRAFNTELNNSISNVQQGISEREFVDRFNNIYSELTTEILTQGLRVVTIPLAIYILLQNTAATNPEYINQIIGSLGIILTAKAAVGTKWKEIINRHNCKRYLTNLERLR